MNYPTLYLMLDQNVSIPTTDHITALCDNQRVGIFNNGVDTDGSFEHFLADYNGIMKAIGDFDELVGSKNVIAIETNQIPYLLKLKYSDQIKAMYWVKDPKTSVDIQVADSKATKFSWFVSDWAIMFESAIRDYVVGMGLDEDMELYKEDPCDIFYYMLSPVLEQLQSNVEAMLKHNQDICN